MSKNKIKNILLIITLFVLAIGLVIFANIKVDSSNGTFTLAEIMATAKGTTSTSNYNTIMNRGVNQLLGYTVTESTSTSNRDMEAQSEYGFCIGQHNAAGGNSTWYITKVLDITSLNNATYNDVNGNSYTDTNDVYSKLAIYAYLQNTYKIEDYGYNRIPGLKTYANSLDYLLPQINNGKFDFSEVSVVTNADAYTGISKDLIAIENNYASFVTNLKNAGDSIFDNGQTKELQSSSNGTTYGPINVKLKSGLSATSVTMHKTYTDEEVGIYTTGVKVSLTVKFTDGTTEEITNSSSTYIKNSSGTKINPDTFDWKSNFYIETSSSKTIEKITVSYSYDTYQARFLLLSGAYGETLYADQGYEVFGGAKGTTNGSYEITVDSGINIYLKKIDSSNSSKTLSNVTLQVFKGDTKVGELTTGSNGITTNSLTLEKGTYTVKEIINNNYGYRRANYTGTFEVTQAQINAKKDITIDIKNTQELKPVTLEKVDKDNSSTKLSGVPFIISINDGTTTKYIRIVDSNNKKVNNISKATISETGIATSSKYGIMYVEYATDATIFKTDDNGSISLENLEVYANSTTKYTYTAIEQSNSNYGYKGNVNVGKSATTTDLSTTDFGKISNTQELRPLKIEKVGKIDNEEVDLSGVPFIITINDGTATKYIKIVDSSNKKVDNISKATISKTGKATSSEYGVVYVEKLADATTFVSDDNGVISIENLEVYASANVKYTYTAIEQSNPNYGYKGSENVGKAFVITDSSTTSSEKVSNTGKFGNLKVEKVDERDESVKLPNVDFKLSNEDGYISLIGKDGKKVESITGTVNISKTGKAYTENKTTYYTVEYVKSINDATILKTDTNGVIQINNLEVKKGDSEYNYVIEEIATNNDYYQITEKTVNATLKTDETVEKTITNKQVYVDLSGYVWRDELHVINSKDGTEARNSLYDDDELRISGVTVRLLDSTGSVVSNADGTKCETTTDSNGEYKFKKVSTEKIKDYYVEFTYDGFTYTSIELKLDEDNGSKAKEVASSRTEFNSKYSLITKDFTNTDISVTATTTNAGYSLNYKAGQTEIANINLGLVEREQTDLAITGATDIALTNVSVNGTTYDYVTKPQEDKTTVNNNVSANLTDLDIRNLYVYESDVAYSNTLDITDNNRLQVFITYKIAVQNETKTLAIIPQEIVDYIDSNLTVKDSWIGDKNDKYGENRTATIEWKTKENAPSYAGYQTIYTTGLKDTKLSPDEIVYIYIQAKVSDEVVLNLINNGTGENSNKNPEEVLLYNVSEVYSYTTYYTENTYEAGTTGSKTVNDIYGSLDKDSEPGNAVPGNYDTYQDDTKQSPTLRLATKAARGLAGTTWEDKATVNNGERLGNGILETGESKVKDVKVELLDADTLEVAKLYTYNDKGEEVESEAVTYTNENGIYQFLGVIPGNYVTRFTYGTTTNGDETRTTTINGTAVDVRDYKSTIVASDTIKGAIEGNGDLTWYMVNETNRYSDAVDNLEERSQIEASRYGNIKESYQMSANTAKYYVGVEYTTTQSATVDALGNPVGPVFLQIEDNMDLGLVERPIVDIQVKKEISYVKVILQSGNTLLEGDPRSKDVTISYTKTGLDGTVPMEIDTELLQGAKLEITYTITVINNSEIDYDYKADNGYYYKYGKTNSSSKLVDTTVTKLADYLDNNVECVVNDTTNTEWKTIALNDLYLEGTSNAFISKDVYDELATGKYIILETSKFKNLQRGKTDTIELTVSKLLAETDDIKINNYTEILELGGDVARTVNNSIPGNYVPNTEPKETDEDSVRLTIAPPTGGEVITTESNIAIIITIVSGLAVIVVAIVIIKKFIIKK